MLDSATGAITGQPATAATSNFTIQVTDTNKVTATKAFALTINPALAITTTSPLPAGTVGVNYAQTLTATGGSGTYTWTVTVGSLPSPLLLNSSTGAITGQPSAAATSSFTIQVTDSNQVTASVPFALTIDPPLAITTSSPLANGTVNGAYNQSLVGTGGLLPYTWSLAAGSSPLPPGLTLTQGPASTGVISGTPNTVGTFPFKIQLSDSTNPANSVTKPFAITIGAGVTITTPPTLSNATVGTAYLQTLAAAGGVQPYTWSPVGALPAPLAALSLSAAGTISGTPTAAGTGSFTVTVTDFVGGTNNQKFTLTIVTAPAITTTSLPNGTVAVAYSQTLAATGGTSPYTWAVTSGSLPSGLSLSTAGAIAGKPSAAGTSSFTVQLTDATGVTASQKLSLTIVASVTITTPSPLPTGEAAIGYSQKLAASGGTPPYTWSLTGSGALPSGLTFSASGLLAGTPATAGTFNFTVQATDSNKVTASTAFALTIAGALAISTPAALSGGSLNSSYSQALAASAGVGPYTWTLATGSLPLPPGLSISPAGIVSGVPTATGTFSFTATVTDSLAATASRLFTIVVAKGLTITTSPALPGATVGIAYSEALQAAGGTAPYTWSNLSGSLPPGLSIGSNGSVTGVPTAAGSYSFTVLVIDSLARQASLQLSLTVAPALSISTNSLPGGTIGSAYSQSLGATGGTPPYAWSLLSGALPGGLTLSTGGTIAGTASAAGSFSFTVQVADSLAVTATKKLAITVAAALSISTAAALPNASINVSYSQTLAAAGGAPPYTWALTAGALPAGLTLNAAGAISGTPTAAGPFQFTATVTDSAAATASQQFTLSVGGGLAISTTTLPGGTVGASYSQTLTATGGVPPYVFTTSAGSLPPGITLTGAVLGGTPTKIGSYTFTIQVTDSVSATATQQFTIAITGLVITTSSPLPIAAVGTAYPQTLSASGGTPPYTWSGALPAGLTLNADGTITGAPTAMGAFQFTVTVKDSANATAFGALHADGDRGQFQRAIEHSHLGAATERLVGAERRVSIGDHRHSHAGLPARCIIGFAGGRSVHPVLERHHEPPDSLRQHNRAYLAADRNRGWDHYTDGYLERDRRGCHSSAGDSDHPDSPRRAGCHCGHGQHHVVRLPSGDHRLFQHARGLGSPAAIHARRGADAADHQPDGIAHQRRDYLVPKHHLRSVRQPVHSDPAVQRDQWQRQRDRIHIRSTGEQSRHFDFRQRDVVRSSCGAGPWPAAASQAAPRGNGKCRPLTPNPSSTICSPRPAMPTASPCAPWRAPC